jgi:hypothetical protein
MRGWSPSFGAQENDVRYVWTTAIRLFVAEKERDAHGTAASKQLRDQFEQLYRDACRRS